MPFTTATRTRVVNFRLTDKEYYDLRLACTVQGARLSDFARDAVLKMIAQAEITDPVQTRLKKLENKLSDVQTGMSRVIEMLGAKPDSENGSAAGENCSSEV